MGRGEAESKQSGHSVHSNISFSREEDQSSPTIRPLLMGGERGRIKHQAECEHSEKKPQKIKKNHTFNYIYINISKYIYRQNHNN
jgi:hypothetical protein